MADCADTEAEEQIFEIRDFTCASVFEQLEKDLALALKRWAGDLVVASKYTLHPERVDSFEYEELRCELHCDYVFSSMPLPRAPCAVAGGSATSALAPKTAPKLERWFGARHTATLSFGATQSIDVDVAQTMLSALLLAAGAQRQVLAQAVSEPLACFVVVEGGQWRRLVGERHDGALRSLYSADRAGFVTEDFRGPVAVSAFFREKYGLGLADGVAVAIRDTFTSTSLRGQVAASADGPKTDVPKDRPPEPDPIEALQLEGEGLEQTPGNASLSWRLRLYISNPPLASERPRCLGYRLRRLLGFRAEAPAVRFVDQWFTLADASSPSGGSSSSSSDARPMCEATLQQLAREILDMPISSPSTPSKAHASRRAAPRGCLLAHFAEAASGLPDLRSVLALWALVLGHLRSSIDEAMVHEVPHVGVAAAPRPARRSMCGARAERVGLSQCLAQQKLELLEACLAQRTISHRSALTSLTCSATGAPVVAPPLVLPRLLTEDAEAEWEFAASAMEDLEERAVFVSTEFCADASAFKAANPCAELNDFLAWRHLLKLDDSRFHEQLPEGWQANAWARAAPRPAVDQCPLFNPPLEAEKALHGLESADCLQFLSQLFRVCACVGIDELLYVDSSATNGAKPPIPDGTPALRQLRVQAEALVTALLPHSSASIEEVWAEETQVEAVLQLCDCLDNLSLLTASLRPKLAALGISDSCDEDPITALADSAAATAADSRMAKELSCAFSAPRPKASRGWESIHMWQPSLAAPVREYVFSIVPDESAKDLDCRHRKGNRPGGRLFVEVGTSHVRLATTHCRKMA